MRKIAKVFTLMILVMTLVAPIQAADLQEGIFGVNWGTHLSRLNNFKELGSNAQIHFYANPKVLHVVNGIEVPEVIYGFYTQQFFAVYLKLQEVADFKKFKQSLIQKYGKPKITLTAKREQTIYQWRYFQVKIKLKIYNQDQTMKLAFYYLPISKQVNEVLMESYQDKSRKWFPTEKGKTPEHVPVLRF